MRTLFNQSKYAGFVLGITLLISSLGVTAQQTTEPIVQQLGDVTVINGSKANTSISKSGDVTVISSDKNIQVKTIAGTHIGGFAYTNRSYGQGDSYGGGGMSYGNGKSYSFSSSENDGTPIEKKKTLTKTYTPSATDRLQISNQFGEVKVELWDKKEIKIDITIIGRSTSEKKAQEYVDGVDFMEKQENGKIILKTEVDEVGDNWWGWRNWNRKSDDETEEKRGIEVNMAVFMPRSNALTVSNKYGKTTLGDFSAPLKITTNYGTFTAEKLTGADKDIFVQYGSAKIKSIEEGDLKINYSKLFLEKGDNLKIQNNYGSINIDEVNTIDAQIQYSSGKIGKLRDSGKLYISYSGDFVLPVLSKTLKSLDIKSNYTAVRLPVNDENNFDFNIDVTYANFKYPATKTSFTENPDADEDDDRKPYHYVSTKKYKGKFGKAASTMQVNIKANYAPVKFVEKTN